MLSSEDEEERRTQRDTPGAGRPREDRSTDWSDAATAEKPRGPPEAERGRKGHPQEPFGGTCVVYLAVRPLELGENEFLLF